MEIIFLGTGTSQGIPLIGCKCEVCLSENEKDKRLRSSILIRSATTTICIDAGPDFRQQMLRESIDKLDAIVFTHEHMDHTAGLDEIRAINFIQGKPVKVFATERVQARLKEQYSYIFNNVDYPGVPQVEMFTINSEAFKIGDITLLPIELMHSDMPVLGFRIGSFTYITDANFIADSEKEKIEVSTYLVLNALRKQKHHSHFTLQEALKISDQTNATHTYFTHVSHQMGKYLEVQHTLPKGKNLAYDGLKLQLS